MSFWNIFIITFILGLTGAMSPGTLFTYTIIKSIEAKKKAFFIGLSISLGHAFVEVILILVLMFGIVAIISIPIVLMLIGLIGGIFLIIFGIQMILDIRNKKIDTSFLNVEYSSEKLEDFSKQHSRIYNAHPFWGGIIFILSNPYWWLWWATIGLSIIVDNAINFSNASNFWAFISGKEVSQMFWYTLMATMFGLSSKFITKKIYLGILIICSLFMVGYGFYLAIFPFFNI